MYISENKCYFNCWKYLLIACCGMWRHLWRKKLSLL